MAKTPRIYITPNILLHECLDPWTLAYWGVSKSKKFVPFNILEDCQTIRDEADVPITINTWWYKFPDPVEFIKQPKHVINSVRKFSGFRPPQWVIDKLVQQVGATPIKVVGAIASAHRAAKACDPKSKLSPEEMLDIIFDKWPLVHCNRVENLKHTPTWLHLDEYYTGQSGIVVVNPR